MGCTEVITFLNTTLQETNISHQKWHFWRWFSFSQGGICIHSLELNHCSYQTQQDIQVSDHPPANPWFRIPLANMANMAGYRRPPGKRRKLTLLDACVTWGWCLGSLNKRLDIQMRKPLICGFKKKWERGRCLMLLFVFVGLLVWFLMMMRMRMRMMMMMIYDDGDDDRYN